MPTPPAAPRAKTPPYLRDGRMVMLAQSHPDLDPEFAALYPRIAEFSMTTVERMYALFGALRYVTERAIPGDVVECGVWRGGSSMLAALTLMQVRETSRRLFLYDTFAGMPEPSDLDLDLHGSRVTEVWRDIREDDNNTILCLASLAEVQANMATTGYPGENIRYVEGPVEQTLPARAPEMISVLRLDTDWYESTHHELRTLYPLLSPGGVVLIDDYGHWSGARRAVDEYFGEIREAPFMVRLDYTGRLGVKPHPC